MSYARNPRASIEYREVQVKYGKLYQVGTKWEQALFDVTSWRFFPDDVFITDDLSDSLFVAYVLAPDTGYRGDMFIFPAADFRRLIRLGIPSKSQRKIYISRLKGTADQWVLRKTTKFSEVTPTTCEDVSRYWRNFSLLD